MDISTGNSGSKPTSLDSLDEDSVMIVGEYPNSMRTLTENTCRRGSAVDNSFKDSAKMQGKNSQTIDMCDDSTCMPRISPANAVKSSWALQIDNSNTMDISIGRSCSKTTSRDSPTEVSAIIGEYSNGKQTETEDTILKETTTSSSIKESAMLQGTDSKIIDMCDESTVMPIISPSTPRKSSLTLKLDNSSTKDISIGSSCSKPTSLDSPNEDSVMIVGEYLNSMRTVTENACMKGTAFANSFKESATMPGKDYKTIDMCDDISCMPIISPVNSIKISLPLPIGNSNRMETSIGSSCSKTAPLNSPTDDSMRIVTKKIVTENTWMEDTTPTSRVKESGMVQGKYYNTIDLCDDCVCMPIPSPPTPSKHTLPLIINSSNRLDTLTQSTCSKTKSAESPTEDSVMMVGDDCHTVDIPPESTCSSHDTPIEGSRMLLEDDPIRIDRCTKRMWETEKSHVCPAESSGVLSGEESKSLKTGTEHPKYFNFHPRVVNRTAIIFSEDEIIFLNKYLKFIIEPNFDEKLALELLSVANITVEVGKLKKHEVWRVQYKLWKAIDIEQKKHKDGMINQKIRAYQALIESINKKLSEGKAVVRKADEGDFIVIIKEEEYVKKALSYFEENCISEIPTDITDRFQAEINKYLRWECSLFGYMDKMKCHIEYPAAPELTPLLKLHKADISIRPFLNTENSPAYQLTMLLNNFLKENYVFISQYSVSCSMALANEIKDKPITDSSRLASLCIRNLYAHVPVAETIRIVENNLFKYGKVSSQNTNELVKLLKMVANFNYFSFNSKFYKQNNGLALGSNLSNTLADIFINNLEHNVLHSDSHVMNKIVYYGRNVDKILLLVEGSKDDIDNISSKLNRFHAKIDFSVEHENNNCIQFLDLDITRLENQLTFNIFRKPTTTDVMIPSDSCHPRNDKEAAFRSLLHRAYNIPMSKADRLKELNIIKQIARGNGYEIEMLSRLVDEVRRNKEAEQIKDEREIVRVPYYGEISEKVVNIFKSYNVKFKLQAKNLLEYNVRLEVGNRKRKLEQAGVYKLKCASCNAIYIGKTSRTFLTRYKEHMAYDRQSAVTKHLMNTRHRLTGIENDLEVLHIEEEEKKRDLLEKFEIAIHKYRFGSYLLNKQRRDAQNRFFDGFVELFLH